MGTKVHCKNYLPGYYSMRDINEDAQSSWAQYYEGMVLNGQFCNGFTPGPLNGYSDYDKEVLKRTMLRHEEIFRKQVCELHRLYRKQRDLMEELKRNREKNFSMQVLSSLSSPFSTPMFPNDMDKSWQEHGFASSNAGCRTPISGGDDSQSHLNSLNRSSFRAGVMPRDNGSSRVDQLPDSGVRKVPRKMLDLELPADAYIDYEEGEHAEEKNVVEPLLGYVDTSKGNSVLQPKNSVKLTLGASQDPCSCRKSSSYLQNGLLPCNLADLNEPLRDLSCEEVATSSSKFPIQVTYARDFHGHQKFTESASCSIDLQKDLSQDRSNGGAGLVLLNMERGEKGQEQPFFSNEIRKSSSTMNAFNSSLTSKNVRPLFEPAPVKTEKAQDFPFFFPNQDGIHSWFREKQSQIIELSDGGYHTADKIYSGLTAPTTPSSFSASHLNDCAKTAPPMASSWRKPSNSICQQPIAVQAFPCFHGSTSLNSQSASSRNFRNAHERWQCGRDYMSTPNFGGETHWYPNGLHCGFQTESSASSSLHLPPANINKPKLNNGASTYGKLEGHGHRMLSNGLHCMDVKNAKGMNLNLAPPNSLQNGFIPRAKTFCDVEGMKDNLSGGISWLRTKSPCSATRSTDDGGIHKEFTSVQGHSQPTSSNCTSARVVEQKKEAEASSSLEVLQDPPPVLKPEGTEIQQNEATASSSSKIISPFCVPQGIQRNCTSFASNLHLESHLLGDDVKNKAKERLLPARPFCQRLDLEEHVHMEQVQEKATAEAVHCFRGGINLNSAAACTDQSLSPESSSKGESGPPSPISIQVTSKRFAAEIDLEAPPSTSLAEEQLSPEPSPQLNHLVQPVQPESNGESLQSAQTLEAALARVAAETIHMISLDRTTHVEDAACHPRPPSSHVTLLLHTLHWFADVVSSSGNDLEKVEAWKCEGRSSDIDGMDYFEYMTLHLEEAPVDECCCRPTDGEGPTTEEETRMAHLLLGRPRRGSARRRRQKRDFQRDILPGLASLSRLEVTEDLQVIGGLVRASGQPWKATGGGRRNAGRNWPRRQARGGGQRRLRNTSGGGEPAVEPELEGPGGEEGEMEGRGIMGWGRTTKRCRRRRCPPGNALVPPPS